MNVGAKGGTGDFKHFFEGWKSLQSLRTRMIDTTSDGKFGL